MNWFAIRTVPTHRVEFQVLEEINWRKPESALVPFEIEWERRRGSQHLRPKKVAIFPCYVFARFADVGDFIATRKFINDLAEAKGKKPPIVALVGYGAKPAVLSAADVSFLQALSSPAPSTVAIHKALRPGQQVRITHGAFAGHEAKVDSVDRKRIKVLLQFLDRMMPVEINPASLVAA